EDFNLNEVAEYSDGIGPSISQIITGIDENKKPVVSDLVSRAHSLHLEVHPYTFRVDSLPEGLRGKALLYILFKQVGIDGIFSDFPDVSGECIKEMKN
ncbi:MAG: glycerophosphodiester phosphodiesterase family protein, partial [Candidatus Riflebacteria bacterium]|nr:glycerophosphodiester phosphodiesterase family protein [Candidatus Riflebacteria bacterium]